MANGYFGNLCYNRALVFSFIVRAIHLRVLGFYWGIVGVILFLLFAIYRLTPRMLEMSDYALNPAQWISLLIFVPWMAWTEGYKGFHKAFAPRVIARAVYLRGEKRPYLTLLAPMFCMGYIYATRKRKIVSWVLTMVIVGLVLLLRLMPQPWRGIVDAGVVTGLSLGILSLIFFWISAEKDEWAHPISLDLPEKAASEARGEALDNTHNARVEQAS